MSINREKIIIKKLRRRIPEFTCKKGCSDCCGPIPFSKWEWDQVEDKREATKISCPYAGPDGCAIYEHRPMVCRMYGTVPEMKCPHGRGPAKMLSKAEGKNIVREYREVIQASVRKPERDENAGADVTHHPRAGRDDSAATPEGTREKPV